MNKSDQPETNRPFPGYPLCSRYLALGPIEEARQRVCRMIDRGEALGVVMGPPGTGKTLLCQKLASLYRHSHTVVSLGDIRVSSRAGLVQQVLYHLGKPHQGTDESALHLTLVQALTQTLDTGQSLLLLIDEAQMLSAELLDEVRMMTNLVRQGRPLVQTLLVGGPRLEDTLADPQLESLVQRIASRCYLHPLTQEETAQYIRTPLAVTGLQVEDPAIASVHHASGGIPRLINQLMDQAIEIAMQRQQRCVDDACAQLAWAELQQLPSPVVEAALCPLGKGADGASQGAPVEFGELDEEPVAVPLPSPQPDAIAAPAWQPAASDEPVAVAPTAEPLRAEASEPVPAAEALFGDDFEQETPVELACIPASEPVLDPAGTEWSLHEEIRRLSATAKSVIRDRGVAGEDAPKPQCQERQGHAHATSGMQADRPQASLDASAAATCDVPAELAASLAVVWSDEEVVAGQEDDRDLLVIEDDVTVADEAAPLSFVASGALRRPPQDIDENLQNLFSRLRGRQ